MKNIYLFFLIFPAVLSAQDNYSIWTQPSALLGKDIFYTEAAYPAFKFYETYEEAYKVLSKNVLFPEKEFPSISNDTLLTGKYRIIKIDQVENNQIVELYSYRYNRSFFFKHGRDRFPFEYKDPKMDPNRDPCGDISETYDDFEEHKRISGSWGNQSLVKTISKSETHYFISFVAYGFTPSVLEKGVKLIFEDGSKWNKPNVSIESEVGKSTGGYQYSAFVELNQADIALFKSKKIKKYRLYIYDTDVHIDDAAKFLKLFNCIVKFK